MAALIRIGLNRLYRYSLPLLLLVTAKSLSITRAEPDCDGCVQDGRREPRGGNTARSLPNPRWMSQRNHPDEDLPDTRYTHVVMQFGQFLDHDITLTPKDGQSKFVLF